MGNIKAGVVVVTEFCKADSHRFGGYIDYIDRDEAVRNVHVEDYNIYQDYMGNPYKTTGLFTRDKDSLTEEEKAGLKNLFREAQKNGSLMWQTVISFDNRWLKENGLWTGYLNRNNERKVQEVARKAVNVMLEMEGLENAVWSAAIHLNTDNVHVHVAIVELVPMRSQKKYQYYKEYEKDGKKEKVLERESLEYRGKFKLSSIEKCKSIVVNEIINQKEMNIEITRLIRESIVQKKREEQIRQDKELGRPFLELYGKLRQVPEKKWRYNAKELTGIRPEIDQLSQAYIEMYHKEDFEELKEKLIRQDEQYRKGYGKSNSSFVQNKIDDLYTRLGNAVLNELKEYDKEVKRMEMNQKENGESKKKAGELQESPEELWQKTIDEAVSQTAVPETEKQGKGYSIKWDEKIREARALTKEGKKEEAANVYEEESRKGNIIAVFEMGQIYQFGIGREKDEEKAQEYFKVALEGFKEIYEENHMSGKKWDYILSGYAAYKVGKLYEKGHGTEENHKEALRWFEKGARKHNCYAYYAMGNMYAHREDMKDIDKAVSYFENAVRYGHAEESGYANYQLGRIYLQEEKYRDVKKAEEYFLRSARSGAADGFAYYQLGRMYQEEGEIQDIGKAVKYLEKAMNQKRPKYYAAYTLGKIYLNEKEVRDIQKAVELFEKATENKEISPHAFYQLGKIYKEQYADKEKSSFYFEKATEAGNPYAQKQIEFLQRGYTVQRKRGHVRRGGFSSQKAMRGLRRALDTEYESYKNQQEYLWNMQEQQRTAGMHP